jgi:hypothetical protein
VTNDATPHVAVRRPQVAGPIRRPQCVTRWIPATSSRSTRGTSPPVFAARFTPRLARTLSSEAGAQSHQRQHNATVTSVLIELAVGDAYGAGFEYVDQSAVRTGNDLSRYVAHPRHQIAPGSYTDDTQMSLAVAEAIVDHLEWTPEVLAAKVRAGLQT